MEENKRIKITHLFGVLVIFMILITIVLFAGSMRVNKTVDHMQATTNEYIDDQESINNMRQISDYLTAQCQEFVVTGDAESAKAYYEEIQTDQRREKSLKAIEKYGKNDQVYATLKDALDTSNALAQTEDYAMRLACEGYGVDPAKISDILVDVDLSKQDKALSKEEKIARSQEMVFGEGYQQMKDQIYNDVYGSVETLMKSTRQQQIDSYEKIHGSIIGQDFLLIFMLLVALFMLAMTAKLVVNPLKKSTELIRKKEPLPESGSAEYAYLAHAFNRMLEATNENHEKLSYEATHDELTGLYNRKYFETMRSELGIDNAAMMIVDVDNFKTINDTYGHEIGDKILQKVSAILSSAFRSGDYVFRIGGDEFVVLMLKMDPELKHVIKRKIAQVNEALEAGDDDLPYVSLSIGIAFSSDVDEEEDVSEGIFRKADLALYKVKEAGRNDYAFYEAEVAED